MYIKRLELLNFQVIKEFNADFNGNVYFITGDNELGKSTLLKAIGALLTGERDDVLRKGETKGFAKMVVGDDGEEFDVSLSFTENNPRGTLTIKQKSTGMATNNVSMLQRIFGYQDFDAVEFSRWSETAEGRRKQIAVVKSLLAPAVRERIEAIDVEVSGLKTERTGVNRDVKTFNALVAQITTQIEPGDVEKYAAPVDITALMERQKTNAQLIEKAKTVRAAVAQRTQQLAEIPDRMKVVDETLTAAKRAIDETVAAAKAAYEKAIADAKIAREQADAAHAEAIATIEAERKAFAERKENGENWLAKYEQENPEKTNVPELLAKAEAHNKKYSLVEQYKEKKQQFDDVKAKAEQMDARIDELTKERAGLIANAKLPIDGLSFTDDGLTLNGIPFVPGKVSDSQILMTATKLVVASNPNMRIFRIARGESLGAKRLAEIVEIARENHFQGFVENVVRGQEELRIEEYTEFEKKK